MSKQICQVQIVKTKERLNQLEANLRKQSIISRKPEVILGVTIVSQQTNLNNYATMH